MTRDTHTASGDSGGPSPGTDTPVCLSGTVHTQVWGLHTAAAWGREVTAVPQGTQRVTASTDTAPSLGYRVRMVGCRVVAPGSLCLVAAVLVTACVLGTTAVSGECACVCDSPTGHGLCLCRQTTPCWLNIQVTGEISLRSLFKVLPRRDTNLSGKYIGTPHLKQGPQSCVWE